MFLRINSLLTLWMVSIRAEENVTVEQYKAGYQNFSINAYKELTKTEKGNIILSPISAVTILDLTSKGTRGQTREDIINSFLFRHRNMDAVTGQFNKSSEQLDIQAAIRLFLDKKFQIRLEFRGIARMYQATIKTVDFSQPGQAASKMNDWVNELTNHRIDKIIDPNQLSNNTQLALINLYYFNVQWAQPFQTNLTVPEFFYSSETNTKTVDMMHGKFLAKYAYNEKLKVKFLNLAIQNIHRSMYFILPDSVDDLPEIEDNLREYLTQQEFEEQEVEVSMPKFVIEATIDFIPILKNLGIKKLFDVHEADLSGMSTTKGLYVDSVIQKAYINITENGFEAAADTPVIVTIGAKDSEGAPAPATFKADHPFIYCFGEDLSSLDFIGRYLKVN